jgi:hypothetical protein
LSNIFGATMKRAKLFSVLFFSSSMSSGFASEQLFEVYLKAKLSLTPCKFIESSIIDEALEMTAKKFNVSINQLDLQRAECLHMTIEPLITGIRPRELKSSPVLEKLKKGQMQSFLNLLEDVPFKINRLDISLGNWVGFVIEPNFKGNVSNEYIKKVKEIIGNKPHISLVRVADKGTPNLEHKYAFGGFVAQLMATNNQFKQLKITFCEICLEIGNEQYGNVVLSKK